MSDRQTPKDLRELTFVGKPVIRYTNPIKSKVMLYQIVEDALCKSTMNIPGIVDIIVNYVASAM